MCIRDRAPVVWPSSVFNTDAAIVVSVIVTASSPPPVTPAVVYIVLASAADPVTVKTELASIDPVVLPLRVLRAAAVIEVSLNVTASFPRPLTPEEVRAVFVAAAVPVKVVTVEALTVPVVFPSSVFKTDAASVVSLIVTASFPRPDNVPTVLAA